MPSFIRCTSIGQKKKKKENGCVCAILNSMNVLQTGRVGGGAGRRYEGVGREPSIRGVHKVAEGGGGAGGGCGAGQQSGSDKSKVDERIVWEIEDRRERRRHPDYAAIRSIMQFPWISECRIQM